MLSLRHATLRAAVRITSTSTRSIATFPAFESILISNPSPAVALLTLNRPKALNALNSATFTEINAALNILAEDKSIGAVVITGSSKAFAAGADIKEMKDKTFVECYEGDFLKHWTEMIGFKKPIIAAVSGYAVRLSPSRRMCRSALTKRLRGYYHCY